MAREAEVRPIVLTSHPSNSELPRGAGLRRGGEVGERMLALPVVHDPDYLAASYMNEVGSLRPHLRAARLAARATPGEYEDTLVVQRAVLLHLGSPVFPGV